MMGPTPAGHSAPFGCTATTISSAGRLFSEKTYTPGVEKITGSIAILGVVYI
jgi:hypothetical protein|tara:strand:+ start:1557 stop:1712 length:156 start_codon:yes stop_codon:yes gene_type:complete